MLAYLIIRDGTKWSNVVRLVPGRTVTIGRALTSQIVIKEDQSSRNHAEIFYTDGNWTLRDLDSRNGTAIGGERVVGDVILSPGDVIRIARTQLKFVHDLTKGYAESTQPEQQFGKETLVGLEVPPEQNTGEVLESDIEPTITHRREKTRFLAQPSGDEPARLQPSRGASQLVRLAYNMANEKSFPKVTDTALSGLFASTHANAGAVFISKKKVKRPRTLSDLDIVTHRSEEQPRYQSASRMITETVLREGEAVLARNIEGDSNISVRDSQGLIHAKSVICAPIRIDGASLGMVHLYSTDESSVLDIDDLEFTLAVAENIALALRIFLNQQRLSEDLRKKGSEIDQLRAQLGVESEIVGSSPEMLRVHQEIARAAPSNATVLIRGENGVGKELVARAVHFSSKRAKAPLVCLNCAALSETLLESELFGHEKGAFTGATDRKIGKFEAADNGTLLLDEIGEMSPSIQAKFLRVLEGHPFERLGGTKPIKVDVRVIAATNRDLVKAVGEKKFRRDLYFRLHVVEIVVPALRKRPSDIIEISEYFLDKFTSETGRKHLKFSPASNQLLQNYHWPGNVRELKNVVERGVLLAQGELIEPEDLTLSAIASASESQMDFAVNRGFREISLEQLEQEHIQHTLKATGWNKSRSAAILGIERSTLDRKIKRYGIVREAY